MGKLNLQGKSLYHLVWLLTHDCGLVQWWVNQNCYNTIYMQATCKLPIINYPPFCLQIGSDGHITSQCLTGHVMMEIQAQGVVSCGKACLSHPRCSSYNLLDQGPGKMECQLNNITLQNLVNLVQRRSLFKGIQSFLK